MHDQGNRVFGTRLGVGEYEIENTFGFRVHAAREVETGKIDAGRRALIGLPGGGHAFRCSQLRHHLQLLCLQFLHSPRCALRVGTGFGLLQHRQRRFGTPVLIGIAAAV